MPALARLWRGRGPTSLGATLVLILTAVGVAGAVGITLLLATVITPSFAQFEANATRAEVERVDAALAEQRARVERAARDYGDWTASYDYMARPTRAFEQLGLSRAALTELGADGAAFVTPDGRVMAAAWLPGGGDAFMKAVAELHEAGVLRGRSPAGFQLRVGPLLAAIGVAQVRRSDGSGAPRGAVVMARVLTPERVAAALGREAALVAPAARTVHAQPQNRAWTRVDVPVFDAAGAPVAAVRFAVPREASLLGRRMLLLAVAGSILLLLLVLMVLRRMIERQVLSPLGRVEAHMQRVRASGSLAPLAEDGRRDEIGTLSRSFNAMLRQLGDLRARIEVQSFALGRSESAVAVMHNVRNALTPVSTILSHGVAQPPPIDRAMLDRAVAELMAADLPQARRLKLAGFVAAGLEAWAESREAMRRELEVGREAMAHALEIIGQQQSQAHERPPLEPIDVTEIVARNAVIARYGDLASIAFSFPSTPHRALANGVILSQVIGNLFGNAAEAIAARGEGAGAIAVTVREAGGAVEIRIADDGEGFDAATGASLFQRGFSTRSHKSGGLGLHWCANSMTAMNGGLRLESAGPGRGATAVLTLQTVAGVALAA